LAPVKRWERVEGGEEGRCLLDEPEKEERRRREGTEKGQSFTIHPEMTRSKREKRQKEVEGERIASHRLAPPPRGRKGGRTFKKRAKKKKKKKKIEKGSPISITSENAAGDSGEKGGRGGGVSILSLLRKRVRKPPLAAHAFLRGYPGGEKKEKKGE